ncbi:MAG: NACHT domain-containing protein [Candidatus Pacebacteria bacterium]|nr:NACHT domain-containing protein [Candidatus Paceibacterota bacterium]
MDFKKLSKINKEGINAAGPRYTPGIEEGAPNIQIEDLLECIDRITLSTQYRKLVTQMSSDFKESCKTIDAEVKALFQEDELKKIPKLLEKLSKEKAGNSDQTIKELHTVIEKTVFLLRDYMNDLYEQEDKTERDTPEHQEIRQKQSKGGNFDDTIRPLYHFSNSLSLNLVKNNKMLLLGEWGTGKTHLLCDITKKRSDEKLYTLFFLAHHLRQDCNPLLAICEKLDSSYTPSRLLSELNTIGKKTNSRTLIIVDGINESDRRNWKRFVDEMVREVSKYNNVALVLSCRSPFERQIFSQTKQKKFVTVYHTGFDSVEFDAQKTYFEYYGIPIPQVPLMTSEFSRPLFLKILCKTLSGKTATIRSRWLKDIASGQKTMTKIFEDFVNEIGGVIESEFSLESRTCWKILKEYKSNGFATGVAVKMAENTKDYISHDDCKLIVRQVTDGSKRNSQRILRRIIEEGLLVEDYVWEEGCRKEVVRFPYQRFSDHLIARYMLNQHLDTSSEKSIRRSFYSNKPLGKIFLLDRWGHVYAMPGLASAIVIEFPERVKRTLSQDSRELVYFLPKKQRLLQPYKEVFLESVIWRTKDSFSKQTDRIFGLLLDRTNRFSRGEIFEVLVTLACRQGHPYSASRLYEYLSQKTIPERDLMWSEFLRQTHEESVVHKMLDWTDHLEGNFTNKEVAKNYIVLLSLFLTTTDRNIRDKATKSLVIIGEKTPDVLYEHTLKTFEFNDPYVLERQLSACYGVLMRKWAFPKQSFKKHTSNFARKIYDRMFAQRAPNATTHILSTDYALGIIELAKKINKNCLGRRSVKFLKQRDVSSSMVIPKPQWIRSKTSELAKHAMRMDFENYTVGRLVKGRRNYDPKHVEYSGVLKQIKWRIINLGYKKDLFKKIDSNIESIDFGRQSRDGVGKIDRYGKKYAWIAFYEIAGIREAHGLLSDRYDSRISDCDIDPSFPDDVITWRPKLNKLFRSRFTSPVAWIKSSITPDYQHLLQMDEVDDLSGPWIMLNGYVSESSEKENDPRKAFTFIRGLLMKDEDVRKLRHRLNQKEYPGNREIPEGLTNHYTFAGEVPWSEKFGYYLRKKGVTERHIEECFSIRKEFKYKKRYKDLDEMEQYRYSARLHVNILDTLKGLKVPKQEVVDPDEIIELKGDKIIPGIKVEIPILQFGWESYHSSENQVGGADIPAPAICDFLNLKKKGNTQDLCDSHGDLASIHRSFRKDGEYIESTLTYLRRDLLKQYLQQTRQKLVWVMSGERDFDSNRDVINTDEVRELWDKRKNSHIKIKVARI